MAQGITFLGYFDQFCRNTAPISVNINVNSGCVNVSMDTLGVVIENGAGDGTGCELTVRLRGAYAGTSRVC